MPLEPRDFSLSMKISRRPKGQDDPEGLRSLLVHRLTDGVKLIWRRSLQRENRSSIYCERCNSWKNVGEAIPLEWDCLECGTSYRAEFISYEELE